ncbi:hypothetical protein SAMN02910456_00317 [Ruminococcaceae bacterium YRB3002]|nr:hypothetical protein SAMN02910456_00317 [Ruminococcaceae bacterium YRB3002]
MADEPIKNDDLISDSEYERALEMLNTSKSARVRKIHDSKKPAKKETDGNGFDPVIPLCLILAAIVLIGTILYFVIPVASNPAMDMTYEEFSTKFKSLDLYKNVFAQFDVDLDGVYYITSDSDSNQTTSFKITDNNYYLDSFEKLTSPSLSAAVQGQSRKFDSKLTFLRAIVEYDTNVNNYSFMSSYFAGFLASVYPDLSETDCYNMTTKLLENYDGSGNYTVYGDYAFRVLYGADTGNSIGYMALEIIPAKAV